MSLDMRQAAVALGGDVAGGPVLAPGPGHSAKDRSLAVKLDATAPGGFVCWSHAGDDWQHCRDHVTRCLGLDRDAWKRTAAQAQSTPTSPGPLIGRADGDNRGMALALWRRRCPVVEGGPVWRYLREARGYDGPIPATLGFLPARGKHPPSMIAAIGLADEPEPGALAIRDDVVRGVHLTRLKPDGGGKAGTAADKLTIGQGSVGTPIVLAPPNDLMGLAITEGIEDGLSVKAATGLGAWAAVSAGRMSALADVVPDYVECVTIFGHRDAAGEYGARELAGRLADRGIKTRPIFLEAGPAP
jgi:hypothetical protein